MMLSLLSLVLLLLAVLVFYSAIRKIQDVFRCRCLCWGTTALPFSTLPLYSYCTTPDVGLQAVGLYLYPCSLLFSFAIFRKSISAGADWRLAGLRCSTRNTVYEVLKSRPGWVETQDDVDWDLCWADVGWVRDMYDQIQVGETTGTVATIQQDIHTLDKRHF